MMKRTGWPPSRRAAQAARIREQQPWLRATGPRTEAGKARAAMNALKHSLRSFTAGRLRYLLYLQRALLDRFLAQRARAASLRRFNRQLEELFRLMKSRGWQHCLALPGPDS
jgi:hypothetical protein